MSVSVINNKERHYSSLFDKYNPPVCWYNWINKLDILRDIKYMHLNTYCNFLLNG